ncbi:Protein fam83g [Saguinus oedipus]|uniref:Protein fam83g n=1 Tax=Saguinus oedipus TaxID=9490 RepID=A0ABQ9VNR7_SAGOE|nr:Protein fam83g [Saguinus oedipus]
MAFSQVQCLDDNHVNWRSSESKPEFFYSEEQRLALEALVARGRDAFYEVLKRENIRDFLSELELKRILETIEVYDPGSEDPRGTGPSQGPEDNGVGEGEEASGVDGVPTEAEPLPSLEYWPQKSDRSIPQLDLGWPDTIAYRGVTRASVYMQPPIDGQAHIKEVVRKMISQAQKVRQPGGLLQRRPNQPLDPLNMTSLRAQHGPQGSSWAEKPKVGQELTRWPRWPLAPAPVSRKVESLPNKGTGWVS